MPTLSLRLLGTPEIRHDGQIVHFATRMAQALLIYLAVEPGLHNRDKLIALLFPDSPPDKGRAAFRTTLNRMRAAPGKPAEDHFIIDGAMVGLSPEHLEVDVQLIRTLTATIQGNKIDQAAAIFNRLALTGGLFLEGFSLDASPEFDDWVLVKQEYLQRTVETALIQLTALQMETGKLSQGIETCNDWLTYNRLSEAAYRQLMRFYIASGDAVSALSTYDVCRAVLLAEFNAAPSRDIHELYEQLQQRNRATPSLVTWHDQLEELLALLTEDALFINPMGVYAGREQVRRHFIMMIQTTAIYFDLYNFRAVGGAVSYDYRVMQHNNLLDTSNDGLTIIRQGKIVFDGTSRTVPQDLMTAAQAAAPEADAIRLVQHYYRLLNSLHD